MRRTWVFGFCLLLVLGLSTVGFAAYQHEGEQDSPKFLAVYPQTAGTKLDHCATCHTGGSYVNSQQKTVSLGSCQWCHYSYGYDASGNIVDTLNNYGKDYFVNGRSEAALHAIEGTDSDGDGYSNVAEINANRYPGNASDDPTKMPPPHRIYTKSELESLPQHSQFLLMNASRNDDEYLTYSGVSMEDLLADAGTSSAATGITVYAPDGFATYHPMDPDPDPSLYHVKGPYPVEPQDIIYYYDEQADIALNADGWADYSAPSNAGRSNGDLIVNAGGLKMILAIKREGANLDPGILNDQNKLDGEGPFRVVPPQKVPSPPDQSSRATNQEVIWPYNSDWDHNAGFSSRTVTMIRVEPLPAWATDIDILEAGWNFVDQEKIIVYGALDAAATLDPNISINLWRAQFAGTTYQGTLTLWANPNDPAGLYWKLTAVGLSPDTDSVVENVAVDNAGTITIPDITYYGTHWVVTLTLYQNQSDSSALYWKLNTLSAK
jgi:hypothetical protein